MLIRVKSLFNTDLGLLFTVLLAYMVGTLTVLRFLPSQLDFIPNTIVIFFLSLGLGFLLTRTRLSKIGLDTIFWLLLFVWVAIQPLFINYDYLDNIIFPLSILLSCLILSFITSNIKDKPTVIVYLAYGLITVGVLNFFVQIQQYLGTRYILPIVSINPDDIRFYGNVAQPNQLAFIYALAISGCHFLYSESSSKYRLFLLPIILLITTGVALSSSRGGLILIITSLSFYLFSTREWMVIAKNIVIASTSMILGYILGIYLLDIYVEPTSSDAITRISEGSLYLRVELFQQAWMQFQHHWVTGVGLGNLLGDSLQHIEEMKWFVFSIHSHNLISQVAAELGIIGLCLLLFPLIILIKGIVGNTTPYNGLVLTCLFIIGLYSFSEYPLWYTRYLVLAVFLLALVNTKKINLNIKVNVLLIALCIIIAMGSVYYYTQYKQYSHAYRYTLSYDYAILNTMSDSERNEFSEYQINIVNNLPSIFGFSDYKELLVYYLLPTNSEQLDKKIEVGNRVLTKYLDANILIKQGIYLALNDQSKDALYLFQGACTLDHGMGCDNVSKQLQNLADANEKFRKINDAYIIWKTEKRLS